MYVLTCPIVMQSHPPLGLSFPPRSPPPSWVCIPRTHTRSTVRTGKRTCSTRIYSPCRSSSRSCHPCGGSTTSWQIARRYLFRSQGSLDLRTYQRGCIFLYLLSVNIQAFECRIPYNSVPNHNLVEITKMKRKEREDQGALLNEVGHRDEVL